MCSGLKCMYKCSFPWSLVDHDFGGAWTKRSALGFFITRTVFQRLLLFHIVLYSGITLAYVTSLRI